MSLRLNLLAKLAVVSPWSMPSLASRRRAEPEPTQVSPSANGESVSERLEAASGDAIKAVAVDSLQSQLTPFFRYLGYTTTAIEVPENDKDVRELFETLPDEIRANEQRVTTIKLYIPSASGYCLVSLVGPSQIRLRMVAPDFALLRKGTADIIRKFSTGHRFYRIDSFFRGRKSMGFRFQFVGPVEVMEAKKSHPSITGMIVASPWRIALRDHRLDLGVVLFSFIASLFLFISMPGQPAAEFINGSIGKLFKVHFEVEYIAQSFQRLTSAFFAAFILTFLQLLIRVFSYKSRMPVKWDLEN
jgi:hypothetical protein